MEGADPGVACIVLFLGKHLGFLGNFAYVWTFPFAAEARPKVCGAGCFCSCI